MRLQRSSTIVLVLLIHLLFDHVVLADIEPIVLVHGGAGTISEERIPGKYRGSKLAARVGYQVLMNNGTVLDAVEEAVRILESDSNFNAGYGSVLNYDGDVEMDASIMDGATLKAGCVAGVRDILHPITLARRVMDKTKHNFLAGQGMVDFIEKEGIQVLYPPGQLVTQFAKDSLEKWKQNNEKPSTGEGGTVGAVAIDRFGNIAAATSTGGLTGKLPGRVGDTPIIGAGTYADNLIGGISATGDGDTIMKVSLVYDILKRMEYQGRDMITASEEALAAMSDRLNGTAGIIGLDSNGNVAVVCNTDQISWAYQRGNKIAYGVRKGELLEETLAPEEMALDMWPISKQIFAEYD